MQTPNQGTCHKKHCQAYSRKARVVGTNSLDDLVLEDLIKVHEAIALKHVRTMLTLMKIWRFDISVLIKPCVRAPYLDYSWGKQA